MNWKNLLTDLRRVMTLEEIAPAIGVHAKSTVHGISTGTQTKVTYEVGVAILALHKRKAKAIEDAKRVKPETQA